MDRKKESREMADVFFPSCKMTAGYTEASRRLAEYMKERHNILPVGCCRVNHQKLQEDDRAIVICTTCSSVISESSKTKNIEFAWQLIDEDPSFRFPDYHGERMTVQDCWFTVDRRDVQLAVRSLLKKMNIEVVEQEESFEKTMFCPKMLGPALPDNIRLAPGRFIEKCPQVLRELNSDEQEQYLREHCGKIETDDVVCYCKACREGIERGGKRGIHLLELVFNTI